MKRSSHESRRMGIECLESRTMMAADLGIDAFSPEFASVPTVEASEVAQADEILHGDGQPQGATLVAKDANVSAQGMRAMKLQEDKAENEIAAKPQEKADNIIILGDYLQSQEVLTFDQVSQAAAGKSGRAANIDTMRSSANDRMQVAGACLGSGCEGEITRQSLMDDQLGQDSGVAAPATNENGLSGYDSFGQGSADVKGVSGMTLGFGRDGDLIEAALADQIGQTSDSVATHDKDDAQVMEPTIIFGIDDDEVSSLDLGSGR